MGTGGGKIRILCIIIYMSSRAACGLIFLPPNVGPRTGHSRTYMYHIHIRHRNEFAVWMISHLASRLTSTLVDTSFTNMMEPKCMPARQQQPVRIMVNSSTTHRVIFLQFFRCHILQLPAVSLAPWNPSNIPNQRSYGTVVVLIVSYRS